MHVAPLGFARNFADVSKGAIFLGLTGELGRYCLKVSWTIQGNPGDFFLVLTPPLADQQGIPFILDPRALESFGVFELPDATIQLDLDSLVFGNNAVKAGNLVASGDDLFFAFNVHGSFGGCSFANLKTGDVLDQRPQGPLVGFSRWSVVRPIATDTITLLTYPPPP